MESNTPDNRPNDESTVEFTRTWRYKLGFSMIVIGNLAIIVGLLLPLLGLAAGGKKGIVGILIIGGEVVSLASIVFLGKEGFKAIKSKFVGAVKASYTGPVGRVRHGLGIVLLLIHVVSNYVLALFTWEAFVVTESGTLPTEILGLGVEVWDPLLEGLFLGGEIGFLLAIYLLGADWWGRFRSLFVWEKPAS